MSKNPRAQRIRITFGRDDRLKYLSHLDLMRTWERVLKRAAIPVLYSEGFSPRPRIALGAPLAVGVTSDCELLDLFLTEPVPPADVARAVSAQLPDGLILHAALEVPVGQPAVQAMLRAATFEVEVADPRPLDAIEQAVADLLARETIPWEHARGGDDVKRYDLRPLIFAIRVESLDGGLYRLHLRLRADEQGSGRPEQVAAALGCVDPPVRLHRAGLELDEPSVARAAHRAAGGMVD